MIAFIKGKVADITEEAVILENNGVGYHIFTSSIIQAQLSSGNEVKFYTYLNVREDAMQLYGFLTKDDLKVFKLLITVNGIGPKAGLSILSVMSGNDLRYAVMSGDSKAISKAPGVGIKTAQKVILELKDKLKLEDILDASENVEISNISEGQADIRKETALALAALGYSQTEAMKAVRRCEITEETTVEDLLKLALKKMV